MKIPFGKPLIGSEEKSAVLDVLSGPVLVHGPKADEFEASFASFSGAPNAVSVSSCTAGMHLAYVALGIGVGDEVIVPAQTHVATAHAVELAGASAVFVDVDRESGNINPDLIEDAIGPRTKAIAVVHYLGVPANMGRICEIANRHGLRIVEDCALAVGTHIGESHVGLFGDVGVFSFYPVKHLTTGEGGIVISNDEEVSQRIRLIRAFGVDRNHSERAVPGFYDTVELGFNYRMSEIHASIGIEQLKKVPSFLEQRQRNWLTLAERFESIRGLTVIPQPVTDEERSSHYCLSALLDDDLVARRPEIMETLRTQGVGTSVYYPQPVPRMTYYAQKYSVSEDRYKEASRISDHSIAFPVGPHLGQEEMLEIGDLLEKMIG